MTRRRVAAAAGRLVLVMAGCAAGIMPAAAQDTVQIEVPPAVYFVVTDVTGPSPGGPNPVTVSFSNADLPMGNALRISVRADAVSFTPPGTGAAIPASQLSWTSLGAAGGIGMNGTLSASADGLVFQGDPGQTSGHVDLSWTLAAPGAGIRAGDHHLTVRWKLESITP